MPARPRTGWREKVEGAGLLWHSSSGEYWNETAFYEFDSREIELLEHATNDLEAMTLEAAAHVIANKLYAQLAIPEIAIPLIESSWEQDAPSIYGRFDLAFDGVNPPKLLEYNADTPTVLLEAAAVQWYWLQDTFPERDQFNQIHERLVALWKKLCPYIPGQRVDFCSLDDVEDGMTVTYLQDTARQAGMTTSAFPIDEIGWNGADFVGPDNKPLSTVFKLYPWEWMVREQFGRFLGMAGTNWIEPAWKMLLSNKAILPVLWDLFPGHPNLLAASSSAPGNLEFRVRKPIFGREGANITLHEPGKVIETGGSYGAEGFIYQDLAHVPCYDGMFPIIGSWVIGHEPADSAAGIGVRESDTPVTTDASRFVPHVIR